MKMFIKNTDFDKVNEISKLECVQSIVSTNDNKYEVTFIYLDAIIIEKIISILDIKVRRDCLEQIECDYAIVLDTDDKLLNSVENYRFNIWNDNYMIVEINDKVNIEYLKQNNMYPIVQIKNGKKGIYTYEGEEVNRLESTCN